MPNKQLKHYLDGSYQIEVVPEATPTRPIFLARIKSMPQCSAQGFTQDEAVRALEHIRRVHITRKFERGAQIPEPDLPKNQVIITRTVQGGGSATRLVDDVNYTSPSTEGLKVQRVG